jgi:hypothetical protein
MFTINVDMVAELTRLMIGHVAWVKEEKYAGFYWKTSQKDKSTYERIILKRVFGN